LVVVPLLLLLPLRTCAAVARPVGQSLAPEVPAAVAETPWTLIRFGTPAAEPFTEQGLDVPADRSGETWTDARRRVEVTLRFERQAPRTAVLDAVSFPGVGAQQARVLLNGRHVSRIELGPERRRFRIDLPAERQRAGENRLALRFSAAGAPSGAAGHRYAARLFGLVVGPSSPALDALASPSSPPFSFWPEREALVQAGPSRLHWAHRWPGAVLHVSGALHPASRDGRSGARLRVTVEGAEGVREVWQAVLSAASAETAEAWVPLPAAAAAQRLTLGVEPTGRGPVWVTWPHLEMVAAQAPPASAAPAADALRRGLAGTNVVMVVLDAARPSHFGCYGYAHDTTPAVDRLAREGVVFERAYTPAVFTLSAMASVWTSRFPDEHHRGAAHDDGLPAGSRTLAELLGARGIRTAGFVGNGMAGRGFGLDRGFGEFAYVGFRAADFRAAIEPWLARAGRDRFLLYLHYREPHTPLDPPPPFDRRFGPAEPLPPDELDRWLDAVNRRQHTPTAAELARYRQLYDGNLAVADRELSWLRERLEAAGVWDRTLVIVTADHGEALHEHGFIGHNQQLYEESVRVPLVVRFPPGGPRGLRVRTPVDLLDLAPTVADAFGLGGAAVSCFRGRSLVDVVAGGPGRGDLLARSAGPRPLYALMDGTAKYVFNSRYGMEELYDLSRDPEEQRNLAATDPLRASVYRQRLFKLLLELPGRWTGEPARWRMAPEQREALRTLGYVDAN
jgi:arylsulfatase A-like enzyme